MTGNAMLLNLSLIAMLFASLGSGFLVNDTNVLMYFKEVIVSVTSKETRTVTETVTYNSNNTNITYDVTTAGDNLQISMDFLPTGGSSKAIQSFKLNLVLSSARGYWAMSQVATDITGTNIPAQTNLGLLPQITMEAPIGKSFHCSRFGKLYPNFNSTAKLGNFTPTVEIFGLQVQAFNLTSEQFGDTWECVGFFSAGIWSGIFIVAMLIGILTWGLAMIMDVKTMDRFDDPKGKAISFAGAE